MLPLPRPLKIFTSNIFMASGLFIFHRRLPFTASAPTFFTIGCHFLYLCFESLPLPRPLKLFIADMFMASGFLFTHHRVP